MVRSHGRSTMGAARPVPLTRGRGVSLAARVALVALCVVAAACDGADQNSATTTGSSPNSTEVPAGTDPSATVDPALDPVRGGSLVVGIDAESPGYHPHIDPWGNGGHIVAKAIFDTLATYDATGRVVPYLAESIEANADATVWTITLRDGIEFHNGETLDAEAVRLNFAAVQASPAYNSQLQRLASMAVVDPLTLELTMSTPWSTFPNSLTGDIGTQIGYMAAPSMLADPQGGRSPIGTGPFSFVEWVPDDHLTVERFDRYWQAPAWLDVVEFRPIPDSTSRTAAFDAGDIDVYYTDDASDISAYLEQQSAGTVTVTVGAPSEPDLVMLNTRAAPLDDVRVRRALAMAVDIDRVHDYLDVTGVSQTLTGPYAAGSFWFAESSYPGYDPAGARALIDEYVAEKGAPVEIEFAGDEDPVITGYQELFTSMWAEVGVVADIVSRPQGDNIAAVIAGEYQAILWSGIGGGDPDADYNDLRSGTGLNFSGFSTSEMDAALDEGRRLTDPEARKAQYAIVQRILGDNVPYIWTGTTQFAVITPPTVQGTGGFLLPDGSAGQAITGGRFFLKDVWLLQ